jgi:hypothetical protein
MMARADLVMRVICWINVAASAVLTFGYFIRAGWATTLWPWPEPGMTYVFLASIFAAIGAAWLWIALTGEFAAAAGIGINAAVVNAGVAIYLTTRYFGSGEQQHLPAIGVCLVLVILAVALYGWSRRLPVRDQRLMPRFVWWSFIAFALTLIAVGSALALQVPRVFPWPLQPQTSTIIGWIFLGAATYFLHAVGRAGWAFGAAPLWSFLAYDIVLFVPYGRLLYQKLSGSGGSFDDIGYGGSINEQSLIVYLIVLIVSTLLALYTAFVYPDTRLVRPRAARAAATDIPA